MAASGMTNRSQPPDAAGADGVEDLSRPPGARFRFALWSVVVIASLAAPPWVQSPPHETLGMLASFGSLLALLVLLATTPPGAIKLPTPASIAVIWAGTLWCVFAFAGFRATQSLIGATFIAPVVLTCVAWSPRRLSPWWAAVPLWSPVVYAAGLHTPFSQGWWGLKMTLVAMVGAICLLPGRAAAASAAALLLIMLLAAA